MSIEDLKTLQARIIKKNKICNVILTILFLVIVILNIKFFLENKVKPNAIGGLAFAELCIYFVIVVIVKMSVNGKNIKIFDDNFKSMFVLKTLKKYFGNVQFNHEHGFDKKFIDSIGMFDTGDKFFSNDLISGEYKNIKFAQSDVHIEHYCAAYGKDGRNRSGWQTLFRGRIMMFDFNKKFKSNMQVFNKCFYAYKLLSSKEFPSVKLEDEEFNNQFSVCAQNEYDAFYILTPHFIEKLKEINRNMDCGIMFCFKDNTLYIMIDNEKDSFEYNALKVIDEQKIEEEILKDIKVITGFVDDLNLDGNLFG